MSSNVSLSEVEFETTMGAVYKFPDVDSGALDQLVSFFPSSTHPQVTLTNVSQACLVLPARIVASIRVDGVERWRR